MLLAGFQFCSHSSSQRKLNRVGFRTIVFIDDSNVGLVHYIHKPKKRMVTNQSSLSGILKGENNVGSTLVFQSAALCLYSVRFCVVHNQH